MGKTRTQNGADQGLLPSVNFWNTPLPHLRLLGECSPVYHPAEQVQLCTMTFLTQTSGFFTIHIDSVSGPNIDPAQGLEHKQKYPAVRL